MTAQPVSKLRRVFSITGVVPLGAFLLLHAWTNARVIRSEAAFADAVRAFERTPVVVAAEVLFVFAPLAAHAGIGTWLVLAKRALVDGSPYAPGIALAMRVTGIVALFYLAMHLVEFRFASLAADMRPELLATRLAARLSSTTHGLPVRGIFYLVGVGSAVFHFATGLWGWLVSSARVATERAKRTCAWACGTLGVILALVFANVIVYYATGTRMFGSPALPEPAAPCPPPHS
jgi:succinate dehydrogenase/fumarate reductase cytochrome b subunit (b558 family)